MRTQQHHTRPETDHGRHRRGQNQARDWLVPDAVLGQHAHRVRADAEERGVAEGHDPGVAEHEVEGQSEENGDQQLGSESQMIREDEVQCDGQHPRDGLPHPQPVASGQGEGGCLLGHGR